MNEQFEQLSSLINGVKALSATINTRGMTQLTTSNNVTDANAYALSGIEKNAAVGGTLANQIQTANAQIQVTHTSLLAEINVAKNFCINELNKQIKCLDTTVYNPGSILAWINGSDSSFGTYVEVAPTALPDRPPCQNCEILYIKFGYINRLMILAIPYSGSTPELFCRSWFDKNWLNDWIKIGEPIP